MSTVRSRVEYWRQSALVRRLETADVVNRGMMFAAVLLLCFLPFVLVLQSVAGRTWAVGFIQRFGLSGEAEHAVRQALTSPVPASSAVGGVSWVILVLGGLAAATAIQELYERVFEVERRGLRDTPWLLLAGRRSWRALFPSALATGICWLGMVIVFRLTISNSITTQYEKYGSIGVVFVIMTLLIAIGVVIMLGIGARTGMAGAPGATW